MAGLSKPRLVALIKQMDLCYGKTGGNFEDCVGKRFEDFVLRSGMWPRNYKSYTPKIWTHGMRNAIVPDAVFPTIRTGLLTLRGLYPESGFLEVKAVMPGTIGPSSFSYQLLGMIDCLADCPAVKDGSPGHLLLITTSGVSISPQLLMDATLRKVAVFHAEVSELSQGGSRPGLLQVGTGYLKNPEVYDAPGITVGFPSSPLIPPKPPNTLR